MGYSTDSAMVRVDFFKPGGKWYTTEAVRWTGNYSGGSIHREFAKSLLDHLRDREGQPGVQHQSHRISSDRLRLSGMVAICLKPYHEHEHPLMLLVDEVEGLVAQVATLKMEQPRATLCGCGFMHTASERCGPF